MRLLELRPIACALTLLGVGCGNSESPTADQVCEARPCSTLDGSLLGDGATACAPHTASCDGNAANGCEATLDSDGKNCGGCGHDCLGGTCTGGICQSFDLYVIPSGAGQVVTPMAIAVDATSIYVSVLDTHASSQGASILKIPIAGGAPETLVPSMNESPSDMLVDGATLYYGVTSGVMRVPTAGGAPVTIAKGSGYRLALDTATIYWTDNSGNVLRTSRDRIDTDAGAGFDAGAIQSFSGGSITQGIAVDATSVYWAAAGSDGVFREPLAGGAPVSLSTNKVPREVKVDATFLYFSSTDSHELGLRRIPLGVGPMVQYVSAFVVDFAIDASNAYWLETGPNKVMKAALGGTPTTQLAAPKASPGRIALDAKAVYYTLSAGTDLGKVVKLAK